MEVNMINLFPYVYVFLIVLLYKDVFFFNFSVSGSIVHLPSLPCGLFTDVYLL